MAQLAAFTQVLTAANIVTAADREAGSPGLYLNPTTGAAPASAAEMGATHGYVALQNILDHLAMNFDWPFRNDAVEISVSTRTTTLPSDWWRLTFNGAILIDPGSNDSRHPLTVEADQNFHEEIITSETGSGRPTAIYIMKNAGAAEGGTPSGVLYTNVVPDRTYRIELHYSPLATPLTAITQKPWFPNSYYLTKAVAVELFVHQDDARRADVAMERDRLFRDIRRGLAEPGQRAPAVRYSRRVFRDPIRF